MRFTASYLVHDSVPSKPKAHIFLGRAELDNAGLFVVLAAEHPTASMTDRDTAVAKTFSVMLSAQRGTIKVQ